MESPGKMTLEEARTLLADYADGLLPAEQARQLEALLAAAPELQAELNAVKEENLLLCQALQPLRPSRSARFRLSEAMADIYEQASRDTERELAGKNRRITRIISVLLAVALCGIVLAAVFALRVHQRRTGQPPVPPAAPARTELRASPAR